MSSNPASSGPLASGAGRWSWFPLAALLILGLAMRTLGAWVYEYAHTSDHGIICLMVKHMLEGKEFPVFFYGLPYMGSIEPAVSAGLCALFGLTGFWINMGTALVAFAFLPIVYLWGRGAAGRTAGLAALAFCVIGPPQYFQFESWADGGYAAIPLLSGLVLLLTLRLLVREAAGERTTHLRFMCLGVAAGLGWWQSPLLIAAFLASALLFLVVMRTDILTRRLVSGAAGFLLGSVPLWLWNFRNRWQTFDMVKTHDSPSLVEGLKLFYLTRLPDLLEFFRHPPLIRLVLGALVILLAALALARLVEAFRARSREQTLYLGAAVLFLVVFSILFGRSRFARVNALRYVLIVIPAMAVMVGAATAWLTARTRWGLGWLPLAALVALQAAELPKRFPERRETAAFMPQVQAFGRYLRQQGITHLYTDYQVRRGNHGFNFLLNEEFVFSPQTRERYRPYAAAMELAEQPAVLNNSLGFDAFLAATRATASTGGVEGLIVQYAVQPPPELGRLVPAVEWEAIVGPDAACASNALTDADAGTGWTMPENASKRFSLEIRLVGERRLTGVRLFCDDNALPAAIAVEGWRESEQAWTPLLPEKPVTRYFWSGSRFYWGGDMARVEGRFAPMQTDRIRLTLKRSERGGRCLVQELQLFTAEEKSGPHDRSKAVEELAQLVRERGLKRLYADRWEANALYQATGGDVMLPLLKHVFERDVLGPEMTLDERTGLLVREREAEATRRALADRMILFREMTVGPWILIDFPSADPLPPHARMPGLRWAGTGCFKTGDLDWAAAAGRSVREAMTRRAFEEAIPLAERALALRPCDRPLAEALALCYGVLGERGKAEYWKTQANTMWTPAVPAAARFRGGIELLGVGFDPLRVAAGETFRMKLYWRVPASANLDGLIAFVHFTADEKTVFQDDHPLVAGLLPTDRSAAPEVLVEERMITVPAGTAPGELKIGLGLYRPGVRFRRLSVESEFRGRRQVVIVPAVLTVAAE